MSKDRLRTRGKQDTHTESTDFENFVRDISTTLNTDLNVIKEAQGKILVDVAALNEKVNLNIKSLEDLKEDQKKKFEAFEKRFESLRGEFHDAEVRVDGINDTVQKQEKTLVDLHEKVLSMERYSREFNLKFHNVPETHGEDFSQKFKNILLDQLNMEPVIENAHRLGTVGRSNRTPGPIMCKFLYRPDLFQVIKRRRELNDV